MLKYLLSITILLLLFLTAIPCLGEGPKVIAYETNDMRIYQLKGKSYVKTGKMKVEKMPPLPVPVLKISSRGYVQIQTSKGLVWIDEYDVVIHPKKTSGQATATNVSTTSQTKGFHTRGIGE